MIQHQDINVGPGSYRDLASDQLLVTKIFYTIQGEGPFSGCPAVFIRLAGCNRGVKKGMGCEFCDTAFHFFQGRPMSFVDIRAEMWRARGFGPEGERLVVITGGEPMMQNNLTGFICSLDSTTWDLVQIESNGDRLANGFAEMDHAIDGVVLVVSPKMVKGEYRQLAQPVWDRADCLKVVVSADPRNPYHQLPGYLGDFMEAKDRYGPPVHISPLTVYRKPHEPFQPVSAWDRRLVDHDATARNYDYAKTLALKHGYSVSMQQHLFFITE